MGAPVSRKSEWSEIATTALRHGQSLREASAAYRAANAHLHNPGDGTSPEMHRRHHHTTRVGSLLRRGVPFHDAIRRVDQGFDAYQRVGHDVERSITHPGRRENPGRKKWLIIGGLALGAMWLLNRQTTVLAGPTQGQTGVVNPNAAQTGGGSYQTLTLTPTGATSAGGYSVYGAR